MKVDFHIHSLYSDGVYTVPEILPFLKKADIQAFSLTDHDTVDGITEARKLSRGQLKFVSGIEFTCREQEMYPGGEQFSIHLLGYQFDEENQVLRQRLDKRKRMVKTVFDQLCKLLTEMGCPVQREEIPISCGNVLQLCDVAEYIRACYAQAEEKVFSCIGSFAARLNEVNIPAAEAIALIRQAGGKSVWAHPFCVYKDFMKVRIDRQEINESLAFLESVGLDGLEADYLGFTGEERKWLRTLARERGLIYTAGSDFHGSRKRSELGIEITEGGMLP